MKNTLIFVAFVLLVLGGLYLISGDRSPRIPDDALHAGLSENAACAVCHGPGMEEALSAEHPPKDDCLYCHKRKRTAS
ncbi:MAG: hypothetical protein P8Y66_02230 [Nitrospirota bacterium]